MVPVSAPGMSRPISPLIIVSSTPEEMPEAGPSGTTHDSQPPDTVGSSGESLHAPELRAYIADAVRLPLTAVTQSLTTVDRLGLYGLKWNPCSKSCNGVHAKIQR